MQSTHGSFNFALIAIPFVLLTGCNATPSTNTNSGGVSQRPSPAPPSNWIVFAPTVTPSPTPISILATPTPAPSATPVPIAIATPTATPSPTPGNVNNLPIAPIQSAEINGVAGAVPSVTYDVVSSHLLKVKVSPEAAPNLTLPGYTNWVFPYGCIRLQVTVNGVTKMTDILRVDGVAQPAGSVCANAPTSEVLDFSADIVDGSNSVTILNAQYDNCRFTNPFTYGCTMSPIFTNHIAASFVQIETDSTYLDEGASMLNPSPAPIGTPSPVMGG